MELKAIEKGTLIYGAKSKKYGKDLLTYTEEQQRQSGELCNYTNLTWLSHKTAAIQYVGKGSRVYEWMFKDHTTLLELPASSFNFISKLFLEHPEPHKFEVLLPNTEDIPYKHAYVYMSIQEKALYEFAFAFGYLSLEDQYQFLLFLAFLIKNKYLDVLRRNQKSIYNKLMLKIEYYKLTPKAMKDHEFYNRLSFYSLDKNVIFNMCLIFGQHLSGIYYPNVDSFWFPRIIIKKMDITEYILFNPHQDLEYIKDIPKSKMKLERAISVIY